ncbi:unnamed protein product [Trichogramma brassicae]|uniref:Uncharacterized protein n=1 Tax=Trichogramma brassicae TaxID=86971 RepID=A0A6H5J4S5_9HYME|nr:unnamed protein product [Trichogramma brassicae]
MTSCARVRRIMLLVNDILSTSPVTRSSRKTYSRMPHIGHISRMSSTSLHASQACCTTHRLTTSCVGCGTNVWVGESTPPSTSPNPVTTELASKEWDITPELNNSVYGNPSSLTIHNDKKKGGKKTPSKLNEISKHEQKFGSLDKKRNMELSSSNGEFDEGRRGRLASRGKKIIIDDARGYREYSGDNSETKACFRNF